MSSVLSNLTRAGARRPKFRARFADPRRLGAMFACLSEPEPSDWANSDGQIAESTEVDASFVMALQTVRVLLPPHRKPVTTAGR
jgi:hypothetical protein